MIFIFLKPCKTRLYYLFCSTLKPKNKMGLDTTHDCWHGPYSSFNRFRFFLANQIGVDLAEYEGYGDRGTKDLFTIKHDLLPLFNHSDCDGELTVYESQKIVSGLNSILENFKPQNPITDKIYIEQIERFRDGCLLAISKNETVEFH